MIINIIPESLELIYELCKSMTEWWIYRGHSKEKWDLKTTLERGIDSIFGNERFIGLNPIVEDRILLDFQRRAHHYISCIPEENDRLEWLSLIQHYGGPTRLLDFTHSFYVALYFAIDKAFSDAAVWCINLEFISERINLRYNTEIDLANLGSKDYVTKVNHILRELYNDQFILVAEPFRMHERLSIQKGVFVIPCNLNSHFIDNLAETIQESKNIFRPGQRRDLTNENKNTLIEELKSYPLFKLIIPKKYHLDIFEDLDKMNINAATLFPGLDGFARYQYRYIRKTEKLRNILEEEAPKLLTKYPPKTNIQ